MKKNRNTVVWVYVGVAAFIAVLAVIWVNNHVKRIPTPLPSPLPDQISTPVPNTPIMPNEPPEGIVERDRGYDEEEQKFAEDGNNIDDMERGDIGALGLRAFSIPKKNNPTKGTQASMIAYARSYLGRPYVFGSNRNNDKDFDCSDFTAWSYKNARGMNIGADSRTQKTYVQTNGQHRWGRANWRKSSPGDLFFFTDYKGSTKAAYSGVTANSRVSHVGIYLGNGQLLHTASAPTGVRIQNIAGTHLEWRLTYVGRPYRG